jgi:hypothetical protein
MTTLATGLAENPILRAWASGRHRLMGIWLGPSGDVYVASHSTGEVKRIGGAALKTVARIRFPWSPTGGLVAPNGDLWILEYRINAARVQRIARHGSVTTF